MDLSNKLVQNARMAKRYVDDLTAWVEESRPTKKRMDAALVAILAVKSDVQEAIKAGYRSTLTCARQAN